ncbi:H-type lectin domain-containing protein [Salibaculum griseiflavum]|jgi:hypothetical protein|uniref:H-type lectin domain-containing protein n=1 Tax=Salibaculum griseiflavum TaxID=1914409 RepID=A0A2V1P7E9_9RHOB|nr:H-type lectin domain-containing protein [Salibaculum griseiflavum]PWG17718.1 hypothetical protein DFK10_05730 [Salibaculum griseiflavum]
MKRFRNHMIGVEQGDFVLFSDFETDGVMWAGEGERRTRAHVDFTESFRQPPAVQVAPSMWDISNEAFARLDLKAEEITEEGFMITCSTWGDTKIARMRVNWMAIGELRYADDWDVD